MDMLDAAGPPEAGADGTAEARHEWARRHDWCFLCFRSADGGRHASVEWHLQTHEIERRSHARKEQVFLRVNLFRACNTCHAGPLATMPHDQQLALAYFSDPERAKSVRLMLDEWLPIRAGKSGKDRVEVADVTKHLSAIIWNRSPSHIHDNGWKQYVTIRDRFLVIRKERGE